MTLREAIADLQARVHNLEEEVRLKRTAATERQRRWRTGRREEFLRTKGRACWYCGTELSASTLHVDHFIPRAAGGSDEPSNLVPACQACNLAKGDSDIESFRASLGGVTFTYEHRIGERLGASPSELVAGKRRSQWRESSRRYRQQRDPDVHADRHADVHADAMLTRQHEPPPPLFPPSDSPLVHPLPRGVRGVSLPAGFVEFWGKYPRKTAKTLAIRSWAKLAPSPELQAEILAAVELQAQSEQWQRDGGQYIPHASTWLNQRRWEDEVAPIPEQNGAKNHGKSIRNFAAERERRNRDAALFSLGMGTGSHRDAGAGGGSAGSGTDRQPVRRLQAAAGGGAGD